MTALTVWAHDLRLRPVLRHILVLELLFWCLANETPIFGRFPAQEMTHKMTKIGLNFNDFPNHSSLRAMSSTGLEMASKSHTFLSFASQV